MVVLFLSEYSEKDQLLSKLRLVTEFCFIQPLKASIRKNRVIFSLKNEFKNILFVIITNIKIQSSCERHFDL